MIDAHEPKNGDFARYVENLSRLPPGTGLATAARAPGSQGNQGEDDSQPRRAQIKALKKTLEARKQQALAGAPDSLFGRGAAAAGAANVTPAQAGQALAGLGRLAGGLSTLLVLTGVVLIGLSLMDDVPWKPELDTAVQFLVFGFIVRFVSGLLSRKT